jgi:molybdopterin/thiamine biosynthesis adenylyltransferase
MDTPLPDLNPEELETYAWQLDLPGFGPVAQQKLKAASVLISRVGGLGGLVALQLAAAGVGRLILASGGVLLPSDLNRQLLQTHAHLGKPRMDNIVRRIRELNPRIDLLGIPENISDSNASELASQADVIVDAAPLFEERFALNRASVALRRPMVECAMYAWEARITTLLPGRTGCLACLHPEPPPDWQRRFPVLGAVSGSVACLGAIEVVKILTGLGSTLAGIQLSMDLASMQFRRLQWRRLPDCPVCQHLPSLPPPHLL